MNPRSLISSVTALLVTLTILCLPAHAQKGERQLFGKNHPFTVDQLPDGPLKTKLLSLKATPRERAMERLHNITFARFDAAQ